jgi:maltooligosyltrehalose trehalohydrolase
MLFQGQEFSASAPFLYFADHKPDLAKLVREGRREFLCQFPSIAAPEAASTLLDPADRATFEACKLDFSERERNAPSFQLHKDLLALRRDDAVFSEQRAESMYGAVLSPEAFLLRFRSAAGDRLIVVNMGSELELTPAPEPLLAPPSGASWQVLLSSEEVKYGGLGYVNPHHDGIWRLSPRTASVLAASDSGD